MHKTPRMQASVIIPNFNRADALNQTLMALAEQIALPDSFEVVVVDDGSSDGSADLVAGRRFPFHFRFEQQTNRGPGAARNRGARQARANLLVFLDADMIPAPDLLEQYLASFNTHTRALFVGRQLPWPQAFSSQFDRVFNYVLARDPGPETLDARWYYMASGNFAIGAEVFRALGGFDEQLWMTEDTDLAYRAHQQGFEIRYHPEAIGYHNHPKTLEQLCSETRSSALWTARLMKKHPTLCGQLPIYRDVEPLRFGDDSLRLVARKLARQLLALSPFLASTEILVSTLERLAFQPKLLVFLYWKILNSYRLIGFRQGLCEPQQRAATVGASQIRSGEVAGG